MGLSISDFAWSACLGVLAYSSSIFRVSLSYGASECDQCEIVQGFLGLWLLLSDLGLLGIYKYYKKGEPPNSLITLRSASKSYLKMVENSDLDSPDGFTKLMDRVEATFIKHFANSNRKKGMNILRPKVKIERHMVSCLAARWLS
ncbi:hypothetical protein Vadar_018808 [Vaccinium darrowii]|uniref:Uncharacterized protein n=1 Tax=Vaccinium darrowii TaxID=229202 RepID=A0ACB7ZDM3_9ERIC|nr:hypothetical protein Vadar_018808 [Vaccinium darrowii]